MLFETKAVGYYKLTHAARTFFAKAELRIKIPFKRKTIYK